MYYTIPILTIHYHGLSRLYTTLSYYSVVVSERKIRASRVTLATKNDETIHDWMIPRCFFFLNIDWVIIPEIGYNIRQDIVEITWYNMI